MAAGSSEDWARRIEELLDLADSVLILVDGAHDSHLPELVRRLSMRWPQLSIVVNAEELRNAEPGSVVVIDATAADLEALNLVRPVLRDRRLRAVFWARGNLAAELPTRAPDLFDWISHRVACPPPRVPRFAVLGLLAADRARCPVAWLGPADLALEAVARAWPDAAHLVVDIEPYDDAVRRVLQAVDGDRAVVLVMRRREEITQARWLPAECKLSRRVVVVAGPRLRKEELSGFWWLHGRILYPAEFRAIPSSTDRVRACRLDLEPEAISLARRLDELIEGSAVAVSLDAVFSDEDPGASLVEFLADQQFLASISAAIVGVDWTDIVLGNVEPPFLRWAARAFEERPHLAELGEEVLRSARDPDAVFALLARKRGGVALPAGAPIEAVVEHALWSDTPDWSSLVDMAVAIGEFDPAIHWAQQQGQHPHWLRTSKAASSLLDSSPEQALADLVVTDPPEPESAVSGRWLALHARVLAERGDIGAALDVLERAGDEDPARVTRGYVQMLSGDWRGARGTALSADVRALSDLEREAALATAWACGELSAVAATLERFFGGGPGPGGLRLEGQVSWRRWLILRPGGDWTDVAGPGPERWLDELESRHERAVSSFVAGEHALLLGIYLPALRLAARARWHLAEAFAPGEHWLDGRAHSWPRARAPRSS